MIDLMGVSKSFGDVHAVRDVSLHVEQGEILCLIGPSGSGKSTLLRCINGLEVPEAGQVYVDGEPAKMVTADYGLMAVPVKAGVHEIRAVYSVPHMKAGIALNLLALGLFIDYLILCVREKKKNEPFSGIIEDAR